MILDNSAWSLHPLDFSQQPSSSGNIVLLFFVYLLIFGDMIHIGILHFILRHVTLGTSVCIDLTSRIVLPSAIHVRIISEVVIVIYAGARRL